MDASNCRPSALPTDSVAITRWRRLRPALLFPAAVATVVMLVAGPVRANAPEFVAALSGKAADEWQSACATATTTGTACNATICGANISIDPGGNPTTRNLAINGTSYNLHDVATNRVDLAAAALLNTLCASGAGDPFLASASSFSVQHQQIESFIARARSTYGGELGVGTVPVATLSVGGAYERGSGSSNGFLLPLSYARNLSETQFMSVQGSFLYGMRSAGETQPDGREVPGLRQLGFLVTPSYGMELRQGRSTYAVGGYLPIAYSKATLVDTDQSFSAFGVGLGGIGTLTTSRGNTNLHGGVAFSARKTGGAFAMPITALVRADHPLWSAVDGYASLSYGYDPFGAKTGMLTLATGCAVGKTEFGLRGFVGGDYAAVLLGFTYHQELEGSFAIERAPQAPEKSSAAETKSQPTEGAQPATSDQR